MSTKSLKIVLPASVSDSTGLRKMEHYYGIEFTRGASDGGGVNGYHKMIGDESLLKELRFHNQMKIAAVKDAEVTSILNQTNWRLNEDGSNSVIDGSDGSDIMQVHTQGVYAILGGSNPIYERFIVSDQPFSYEGDVAIYYPAYGECPDYETIVDGQARSIRNDDVIGSFGPGYVTNSTDPKYGSTDSGGFSKTNLNRMMFEEYARAKNPNINSNLPYMNVCNQDIELTAAFMFIEFRTKQLNSLLGHGLSSNIQPTAQNWGQVTGLRISNDNGQTYQYLSFRQYLYINNTSINISNILNNGYSLLKMFEAQLAVSGGEFIESVVDADGNPVAGYKQGVMTGIWTKTFSFTLQNTALNSESPLKTYSVDCVLRVPIWRGRSRLWSDIGQWYSGYECIKYLGDDNLIHHILYRSPSVESLIMNPNEIDVSGQYAFEKTYEYCGELPTIGNELNGFIEVCGDSMAKNSLGNISTCVLNHSISGASIYNYECTTLASSKLLTDANIMNSGCRFGGYLTNTTSTLRSVVLNASPSYNNPWIGSAFRVTLK